MALTSLSSAAEVLVATGHDPFARGSLRRPLARGWVGHGATAWMGVDAEERSNYLSTQGAPASVGALLGELLPELPSGARVTVPRGTRSHLPAWVGLDGTDWDFRWTDVPPPEQAHEHRVEPVEDADGGITGLLRASSPRASAQPGTPGVRRWVGIRSGEDLLACAADTSSATGVGHLSSIAVAPTARGQGLGRAVTAALTRRLLDDGCEVVTLGMYADNTAGRALYDGLGFRDEHRFTSGPLIVRSRW